MKLKCITKIALARVSAIIMILILTFQLLPVGAWAASTKGGNRMNVVFVIDHSGSMNQADRGNLRFDAMELFLGLAADQGNYMGAVVFTDEIVKKVEIFEIGQSKDKLKIKDIRNTPHDGKADTDIGLALNTATEMLKNGGNPSLESAIVIMSDGNTDGSSYNRVNYDKSERMEEEAVSTANAYGIKVYSVCLNADNSANKYELESVSDETGGDFREVKTAEDLKDVFRMFYEMIFGTDTVELADDFIPESGELEVPFSIPQVGVEEANIIISTLKPSTYSLENPDGKDLSDKELDDMTIKANTFTVIKIPSPQPGEWTLRVKGVPRDNIQVNMVYNSDLEVNLVDRSNGAVAVNKAIPVEVVVLNQGKTETDSEVFRRNPIHLEVVSKISGKSEDITIPDGNTTYDIVLTEYDDYDVTAYLFIDEMKQYSNTISFSVGNTKPIANNYTLKKMITPFSSTEKIKLEDLASDTEDAQLNYSIESMSLDRDVVELNDGILSVDVAKSGSGSIELIVTDSQGGTDDFTVYVEVTNIFLIIIILLCILIATIIALFVIKNIRENNKVIPGTVKVIAFSNGMTSAPETMDGVKGKMFLSRCFNIDADTGINLATSYFKAGKKTSYIYFESKKAYETDYNDEPSKQIRLDDRNEVTIYGSEDHRSGLRVTYKSMDDGVMF